MTTKQKKVLDYMIKWAEKEVEGDIYDSTKQLQIEALAKDGPDAMYDLGAALFYGLQKAGYSYKYMNDAAYGGDRGGYIQQVLWAIEQPFKDYFTDRYENKR